jgi:gluconate 2-dehydrogenase gamma chain
MSPSQTQSRRRFLLGSAALAPMIAVGHAQEPPKPDDLGRSTPAPATPTASDYKPGYFTADEWRFVNAACDRLIPTDDIGPRLRPLPR